MPDTKRTLSALQALLADNTAGNITPQHVRDFLVSAFRGEPSVANVATDGSDTIGGIDSGYPFLTINAALDALPAGGGIVNIGVGTFNSPTASKIKSNTWFRGSGKSVPNWTAAIGTYPTSTLTAPTKLVGGTICNNTFSVPYNISNVKITDMGFDCGSDWCNASNGGTAVDVLAIAQDYNPAGGGIAPYNSADGVHRLQTATTPRTDIVVRNVACLAKASASLIHAALFENCYDPIVENLSTYFGFAGLVIKCYGGTFTNTHHYGHGTYGLIVKSNDYSHSVETLVSNFRIGPIVAGDGAGLHVDTNDTSSPGMIAAKISNGLIRNTTTGVATSGPMNTIDSLSIDNVTAFGIAGVGFAISNAGLWCSVTNCIARGCTGDGFNIRTSSTASCQARISDCEALGCTGDGFDLSGGNRVDFFDITALTNTGFGIRAGTNVYGADYVCQGNTAGQTTGTINQVSNTSTLYETTGPTTLAIGSIVDGEYLKRVGSTVVSAAVSGGGTVYFAPPGHRLSLTTGVAVTTTDVTAAGTIYWTPHRHNVATYYTGTVWATKVQAQISLALTLTSGKNYDVFYNGTILSLSAAWTNDTTRANALGTQDGVTVLGSDATKLWVGTIRASGTNTTEDSATKRFVWNCYNRTPRTLLKLEATDSWTYSSATFRQANNSAANQVEVVNGALGDMRISLKLLVNFGVLTTGTSATAIAEDSTTTPASGQLLSYGPNLNPATNGDLRALPSAMNSFVLLGYHYYAWIEASPQAVAITFYGDGGAPTQLQSGLSGHIEC